MKETLRSLMKSRNSLRIEQDESGRANILGVPIQSLGGDRIKRRNNVYALTEDTYEALSSTEYSVKGMKTDSDVLMF